MLRLQFLYLIIACGFCFAETSIIMTPEDIVRLEKPTLTAMSPDGTKVVYGVKRANIEENKNTETLYLWTEGETRALFTFDHVKQLFWHGDCLYAFGDQGEGSQIIQMNNDRVEILLSSPKKIHTLAISPDDNHFYYSQTVRTSAQDVQKAKDEGYVYRWGKDFTHSVMEHRYDHNEWDEIWHVDRTSKETELVTRLSYERWRDDSDPVVSRIALSGDGEKLAIQCRRTGDPVAGECYFCSDLMVWDLRQKKFVSSPPKLMYLEDPCWISERELCFVGAGKKQDKYSFAVWVWDLNNGESTQIYETFSYILSIDWDGISKQLLVNELESIQIIPWDTKEARELEIPPSLLHLDLNGSISWDRELKQASAITEDTMTPPQVVIYDFTTQKLLPISSLNQNIQKFSLGKVEKIEVSVDEEIFSVGYLIHPVGEIPGHKYPLILANYGFLGQSFIADAEWHSSFPAQTLAGEGYAVLLLNSPNRGCAQSLTGNPTLAQMYEGWDRLKVFEKAVDILDERGLIDPTKVGIYGWSNGAFAVEFLISHSKKFQVAALGEGGDYNPFGSLIAGGDGWLKIYENIFGGPPWGKTLENYFDFSPYFSVDKIEAPLLMEFANVLGPIEMYVPLRYLNIPTELVIYDEEEHNFKRPKSRIFSMQRKIDWFNYWLLGKENPDHPEQTARWDQMAKANKRSE